MFDYSKVTSLLSTPPRKIQDEELAEYQRRLEKHFAAAHSYALDDEKEMAEREREVCRQMMENYQHIDHLDKGGDWEELRERLER